MKKEELARCACGGTPKRVKLPNGKWMVKCTCGLKTKAHGRKAEATKEWKELAGQQRFESQSLKAWRKVVAPAPAPAPKAPAPKAATKAKAAPKKPAAKAAPSPTPAQAKGEDRAFATEIALKLSALHSMSNKLTKAIDELGQTVVQKWGIGEKEVLSILDRLENPETSNVQVVKLKVTPGTAKRILEAITKMVESDKKGGK